MSDSSLSRSSLLTPLLPHPAPSSFATAGDCDNRSTTINSCDKDYSSTQNNILFQLAESTTNIHKRVNQITMSSSKCISSPCIPSSSEDESPVSLSTTHRHLPNLRPKRHLQKLIRSLHRNIAFHRRNLTLSELSGSLGDLGTFIPLTVALARERKIALAPALFWAGMSNLLTGMLWDVPMCVQPMKAIAAVALTEDGGFDAGSVTTAGILSGASVLFLGVTNLMEVVNWLIPLTVVCGLQVGVGLRLASAGIVDIQKLTWWGGYDCIMLAIGCSLLSVFWLRDTENGTKKNMQKQEEGVSEVGEGSLMVVDESLANTDTASRNKMNSSETEHSSLEDENGRVEMGTLNTFVHHQQQIESSMTERKAAKRSFLSSAMPSFFTLILKRACCCFNPSPKTPHPVGIYLFLIGCIFAAITLATATADSGYDLPLHFFGAPVVINAVKDVTSFNWRQGFFQGTLPQLPLTTLNSVISVCCLAHALYPEKRHPALVAKHRTDAVVTRREVCISVGLMNLILVPLGGMPNCHGAGGLAGQHRFGARHGTAVVILGSFKILIAVFFGGSALTLLDALPVAVLGIMLVIAGLELVGTGVSMLFDNVKNEVDETSARIEASGQLDHVSVNSSEIMRKNCLVAMVTAGVIVALQKTHYGAISGLVVHTVLGCGKKDFDKVKLTLTR